VPAAFVPMRLPRMTFWVELPATEALSTMRTPSDVFPEMTLPTVPPMTFPGESAIRTPVPLPRPAAFAAFVPMKLPATVFMPARSIFTPSLLPTMTFPAPAAEPPIVFLVPN